MKITLLAIGRRHDRAIAAAIDDYTQRISHYAPVQWRLFEPAKGKLNQTNTRWLETQALLGELQPNDYVILLDERGTQFTSPEFAARLSDLRQRSVARAVFIIGGAYGVDESLRTRAQFVWSLSPLVFPHQVVRLLLAEQLYRGFSIVRGERYHHE